MFRTLVMARAGALAFIGFCCVACSTLPKNFTATQSNAIAQSEPTSLGKLMAPDVSAHPGASGFALLNTGRMALLSRLALADIAERTIDCQYFIWQGDASGVLLMDRLIKAADRGVRVRLLIDDMTSHGKDLGLAALDRHSNIEVRLFNPLGRRYYLGIFRTMALALHAGRMTNRMHNKIFAVDNQVAIVGGRNIADEYFGVNPKSNFRDLDLFSVGPIVNDVSTAFDDYWNSPWSVPLDVFKIRMPSEKKYQKELRRLSARFEEVQKKFPYKVDWQREKLLDVLKERMTAFVWAPAEVVCDAPDKAWQKAQRGKSKSEIVNRLGELLNGAKHDILVVSPYFILSKQSLAPIGHLVQRGVSLRIFTNSLASTDAIPVIAMYRPMRDDVLRQGAGLFEMRPDAATRSQYADASVSKARTSLHAKAAVIDRQIVFVGTFNIDPRSEHLNTEVGIFVRSPELAEQLYLYFETDLAPANSYALRLGSNGKSILWVAEQDGKEIIYTSDPEAGFWLRLGAGFMSLLPIQHQL